MHERFYDLWVITFINNIYNMKYDSLNEFVETGYRYAMEPFER